MQDIPGTGWYSIGIEIEDIRIVGLGVTLL